MLKRLETHSLVHRAGGFEPHEWSRIASVLQPESGSWQLVWSAEYAFAFTNLQFRSAWASRLGLPCPISAALAASRARCICAGHPLIDTRGYHLSTCKLGGGTILRHDIVNATAGYAALDAGVIVRKEVLGIVPGTSRRADLIFHHTDPMGGGRPLVCDTAISHPSAVGPPLHALLTPCTVVGPHLSCSVSRDCLFAIRAREAKKKSSWGPPMDALGYDFVPLAADAYGALGQEFVDTLSTLSKRVDDGWAGEGVLWSSASFKTYWTQRIVTAIVKETADHKLQRLKVLAGKEAMRALGSSAAVGGSAWSFFGSGLPPKGWRWDYRISPSGVARG